MIEFFKHTFGLCGEHWHPNFITALAGSPMILLTYNWLKCKCGEYFGLHKKDCKVNNKRKNSWTNFGITDEDIYEDINNCSKK
jgi:hypothetical protein